MIRDAMFKDIPYIADIAAKDMCALMGSPELHNGDYLADVFIPNLLLNGHICLVSENNDTIDGVIGGIVGGHVYNPNVRLGTELIWWVREDKRGTSVGYRLLKAFEEAAKHLGCSAVVMTLMPSSGVTLEKLGYTQKESAYHKGV